MRDTAATILDVRGQIALPPALCRQLEWDVGRRLLAVRGAYVEAILALSSAPCLLLIEPAVLAGALREAQQALHPAAGSQGEPPCGAGDSF